MGYAEWQKEVIRLMAAHRGCTEAAASAECQDLSDMHADGLSPDEARAELCYAAAEAT